MEWSSQRQVEYSHRDTYSMTGTTGIESGSPFLLVTVGLSSPDREHRVQQQHPLPGPALQAAVLGTATTL